jgi:hypothetical protein
MADLGSLDGALIVKGYTSAERGDPEPDPNRGRSFWHGWRNRIMDLVVIEHDEASRNLARTFVAARKDGKGKTGGPKMMARGDQLELAIGQIWKENDKRIIRYVKIVQTPIGGRRVRIRACKKNGEEIEGRPTTETDVLRHGQLKRWAELSQEQQRYWTDRATAGLAKIVPIDLSRPLRMRDGTPVTDIRISEDGRLGS